MGYSVMMQEGNQAISPQFRVSDWRRAAESGDWPLKIAIFQDRLNGRYLKPVDLIENDEKIGQFAGFSIMALACLMVETLNQFYQGVDKTPSDHQRQFWKFFRGSEYFRPHFTRRTSDIFYNHVRCGLLHQAQTKEGTLIRADQPTMIQSVRIKPSDGIIVDRVRFVTALKEEIEAYVSKLKSDEVTNAELRENFVKKMWCICGER